jgi:hypothetical protein
MIPVPDAAKRQYPNNISRVIAAPDGDLLNDEIRPLDTLIDKQQGVVRSFWILEEGDLSEIDRFKQVYIELGIHSWPIPPVSIICWPDGAMGLKTEAESSVVREAREVVEDLQHKVKFLMRWINDKGLLEDGTFTFPDGDTWYAPDEEG